MAETVRCVESSRQADTMWTPSIPHHMQHMNCIARAQIGAGLQLNQSIMACSLRLRCMS